MHALLDEVVGFAREAGDGVAERAISLSYHPDDRPSAIARETILPEFGVDAVTDRQVIITSRRSSTPCKLAGGVGRVRTRHSAPRLPD
jgi:DNA-binding ferritin-like protein